MPLRLTEFEFRQLLANRERKPDPEKKPEPDGSKWEEMLAVQLIDAGLTPFRREYRFVEDRRFRFDFAWPAHCFACEIDGAVHRTKKRYTADQEKGQLALLGSWRVLHVTPKQVRSGEAISLVKRLISISMAIQSS